MILIPQIHHLRLIYPFFQLKKIKLEINTHHQHLYGTRSKTRTNAVFQALNIVEDSVAELGWDHC